MDRQREGAVSSNPANAQDRKGTKKGAKSPLDQRDEQRTAAEQPHQDSTPAVKYSCPGWHTATELRTPGTPPPSEQLNLAQDPIPAIPPVSTLPGLCPGSYIFCVSSWQTPLFDPPALETWGRTVYLMLSW